MVIDDAVLEDAAYKLHLEIGSLLDLPEELQSTLASLYYEISWMQTKGSPLVDHLPPQSGRKMYGAAMKQFIVRTAQYQEAAAFVEIAREARKESGWIFEEMTRIVVDILKWNVRNSFKKSRVRRSIEKSLKKPLPEMPRLYDHMRRIDHAFDAATPLSD